MDTLYDVIIIGSGPAGLTAATYTTRANLKTLIVAGFKWGGQLQLTSVVENYPGFPEGIEGPELMTRMRKQAEHFGAEVVEEDFISGDFKKSPFTVKTNEKSYQGKCVIIATGADTKWLGVPGEKEKIGRGVSSCAPCDGPFFKNKDIIVVGGGDSAMEEALVLTKFAKTVTLVHRRDEFRASNIMIDRAKANPKIQFLLNSQIQEVLGENKVEGVRLMTSFQKPQNTQNSGVSDNQKVRESDPLSSLSIPNKENTKIIEKKQDGFVWELPIGGIFVAIGHMPNSKVFEGVEMDEKGFIKVHEHYKTNIDGVFVAGDVHDRDYKQAVTAAGFGCAAALEAEKWLDK